MGTRIRLTHGDYIPGLFTVTWKPATRTNKTPLELIRLKTWEISFFSKILKVLKSVVSSDFTLKMDIQWRLWFVLSKLKSIFLTTLWNEYLHCVTCNFMTLCLSPHSTRAWAQWAGTSLSTALNDSWHRSTATYLVIPMCCSMWNWQIRLFEWTLYIRSMAVRWCQGLSTRRWWIAITVS